MDRQEYNKEIEEILSRDDIGDMTDLYNFVNKHNWFSHRGALSMQEYGKILDYTRYVDVESYCDLETAFDNTSYQKTLAKMAMQSFYADLAEKSDF